VCHWLRQCEREHAPPTLAKPLAHHRTGPAYLNHDTSSGPRQPFPLRQMVGVRDQQRPHLPSSLRAHPPPRARPPFPRALSSGLCAARPQKHVFYPRANFRRSNFPRFVFSKRGFCACPARKTPPESHPRFPRICAQLPRVFLHFFPPAHSQHPPFTPQKACRKPKPALFAIPLQQPRNRLRLFEQSHSPLHITSLSR
jgi:hypothetical protein